jgi:hypothetical protein
MLLLLRLSLGSAPMGSSCPGTVTSAPELYYGDRAIWVNDVNVRQLLVELSCS